MTNQNEQREIKYDSRPGINSIFILKMLHQELLYLTMADGQI
ncbi:hypothetical protein SVI_0546 [Shewanella violacea DSS12]|uniref:Uncharacterized protein n=1 Tax=Shewanella violacea (strain JCM 10179 / CIP 106290 / LMG 19151 / DSS12) TaxID=637905 RepID=D4ZFR8_SHEVD|nr:hypothetical protein SVI_0546 [Shewanella violacea DSS12]